MNSSNPKLTYQRHENVPWFFFFCSSFCFCFYYYYYYFFFFLGGGLMSQDKIFSGVEETSPKKSWIFEYADSI